MTKIKTYSVIKPVTDNNGRTYTIFVYGEVTENNALDGIEVRRVRYHNGSNDIEAINESRIYPLWDNRSTEKVLNFGFAICAPEDDFNEEIGIKLAKKRFSRAPIRTQDCRFLKEDMVKAILNQTADYVAEHELQEAIKHKEFFENFHNGEIVKLGDGDTYAAISISEDRNITILWKYFANDRRIEFRSDTGEFAENIFTNEAKENLLSKADDGLKATIQDYLRERYRNQWDENNAKFIKA